MNISIKKLTTLVMSAMLVFTLSACSDGPAEDAGEEFDKTVKDLGNAVEDACEEVKEGVEAKDEDC